MFEPDPTIAFVPASRQQVVALVESLNQPQISIPGKPPQSVQAHLCGLRNANGSLSLFVSLHLPLSAENVVYVQEPRELPLEAYRGAEADGLHFLESMGFMLDNLNFQNLGAEQQDAILKRVPLFSPTRSPPARVPDAAAARAARAAALARLLVSF